jgi:hypothetical protein
VGAMCTSRLNIQQCFVLSTPCISVHLRTKSDCFCVYH